MAAGPLDHARGDRPAGRQRLVVAQELLLGAQVADARLHPAASLTAQALGICLSLDLAGHLGGLPGQQHQCLDGHPVFRRRIIGGMEAERGLP